MSREPFHINMLGTSFSIRTDEDPVYLKKILTYLEEKQHLVETSMESREPLRVAILSSILVADELFQERLGSEKAAEATGRLIQLLDKELT